MTMWLAYEPCLFYELGNTTNHTSHITPGVGLAITNIYTGQSCPPILVVVERRTPLPVTPNGRALSDFFQTLIEFQLPFERENFLISPYVIVVVFCAVSIFRSLG